MNKLLRVYGNKPLFYQFFRKMKLTILILTASIISCFSAETYSQVTRLTINENNSTLLNVLKAIEGQSEFKFFYNEKVDVNRTVSVEADQKTITEILDKVLSSTSIKYKVLGRQIALYDKEEMEPFISEQQGRKISGKVTDNSGSPLPGVSVVIKGTTTGVITDNNGKYSLPNVPENATLQFSFVGMKKQEIESKGNTNLDVVLQDETIGIDEVVAIGYGTQRKKDITSAISIVDVKGAGDIPVSNASRMLQGQAAGVVVKQNSGTPGEQMNITIRGVGSLGAGSDPLYVIDGFAVGTSIGQNLNPNDIESISILKDAASTAIYGARGSNGVVLITTKNAKEDELTLTVTANYGIQNLPDSRRLKMMNGVEFATFLKESWMDKKRYFEHREPSNDEVPIGIRNPEQTKYSTNWFNEILNQNAPFQDYNVTLASGKGKIKSLVSLGYLNQEGALVETNFQRYTIRANVTGKFNDFITTGINLVGSRSGGKIVGSNGRDAIVGMALWADPRDPVYNEDGSFKSYIGGHDGVFGSMNPVQMLHEYVQKSFENNMTTNGFVEVSFLKDFKFKSSFNASLGNLRRNDFKPSTLAGGGFNNPPPQDAFLEEWYEETITTSADQLLSYAKTINKHQFEGMLGYSAQESTWRQIYGYGTKFPNDEIRFLQQAENTTVSSSETSWSMLAYFARLNYSFQNKYLLAASFRREGSSRFGANNKWGDFPAVSVGWRLSEESFMPKITWLSDLKLRGSYGITGNNSIGEYKNSSSLTASGYILGDKYAPGVVLNSFVNDNIGWEESNQLDLGMDLSIFQNKLSFTAEYYKKITTNMLLPVSIPVITGFNNTFTNIGKVQNNGFEFEVNYKTKINNDLNFRCNLNVTFNRNKVLSIDGQNDELWTGSFYNVYNRSKVGRPIGMITGFKVLGIFNTDAEIAASPTQDGAIPGVYKYLDASGDGKVSYDTKDMVEIGNPWPKYNWGLTIGGDYKNFDLNILLTGAMKYDIERDIEKTVINMDGVFNILQSGVNRWRSATNPGDGVGATSNTWKWERESNSRYVYDASHAWIKSVTIGYTLPKTTKILKGTRFYFSADNLLLITKYPGNNPDVNTGDSRSPGRDDEAYPIPRTLAIGANIKF